MLAGCLAPPACLPPMKADHGTHGTCEAFVSYLFFSLFFMSFVCFFHLSDSSVPLELSHALLYSGSSSFDIFPMYHQDPAMNLHICRSLFLGFFYGLVASPLLKFPQVFSSSVLRHTLISLPMLKLPWLLTASREMFDLL